MPMQDNQSAGGNVGAGVTCKVVVKQDQLLIRVYTNSCFMEGVFEENKINISTFCDFVMKHNKNRFDSNHFNQFTGKK